MNAETNEKILIKRAKDGDTDAFEQLILGCKGKAYNIALKYMKNQEDALDVLQESFLKIFRHLNKFHEESKFDTWVYRIVVNTCNDMLRKNSHHVKDIHIYQINSDSKEEMMDFVDPEPNPEESFFQKEGYSQIELCMESLTPEHREIIILRDIQEMTYDEICHILDCNVGTVKSRLNRARTKLREIYIDSKGDNLINNRYKGTK